MQQFLPWFLQPEIWVYAETIAETGLALATHKGVIWIAKRQGRETAQFCMTLAFHFLFAHVHSGAIQWSSRIRPVDFRSILFRPQINSQLANSRGEQDNRNDFVIQQWILHLIEFDSDSRLLARVYNTWRLLILESPDHQLGSRAASLETVVAAIELR